jgi:hypothetical protein
MTDKKDEKETIEQFIREKSITKAPPPITPLDPKPSHPFFAAIARSVNLRPSPIVPITALELMERWSIDATTLIMFSYNGLLFPEFPEDIRGDVKWLLATDQQTRDSYLSKCIYDRDIVDVVEVRFHEHLEAVRKKALPEENKYIPAIAQSLAETYTNAFIRQSDTWEIWYQGKKMHPIINMDGLAYIAYLLKNPSLHIHVTDLCGFVKPPNRTAMMTDKDLADSLHNDRMSISTMRDERLDSVAKDNLKRKIHELKETIADNVLPESERREAQNQYDHLVKTIATEYGPKALSRKAPLKVNESVKRDLDRAGKAIKRAYKSIKEESPELADYLEKNITTGTQYSFTDTHTSWHISI